MDNKVELVIISGRSGSGKTVALHALEDLGFYCIDNLPIAFLKDLIEMAKKTYLLNYGEVPFGDITNRLS